MGELTYPQLRCFAACSGFHNIGPAPRNPQLSTQSACIRGCVATARRHSLLRLYRKLMCYLTAKQEFSLGAAPCPDGTRIYQKPTASSEGAQLWDKHSSPSLGSAKRDQPSSTLSGMCKSPFWEHLWERWKSSRTHSCAASQLAVGFMT